MHGHYLHAVRRALFLVERTVLSRRLVALPPFTQRRREVGNRFGQSPSLLQERIEYLPRRGTRTVECADIRLRMHERGAIIRHHPLEKLVPLLRPRMVLELLDEFIERSFIVRISPAKSRGVDIEYRRYQQRRTVAPSTWIRKIVQKRQHTLCLRRIIQPLLLILPIGDSMAREHATHDCSIRLPLHQHAHVAISESRQSVRQLRFFQRVGGNKSIKVLHLLRRILHEYRQTLRIVAEAPALIG